MSNDLNPLETGPSNRKTHGNSSHEANDPLPTVDTGDRPCGASPPHESAGQSSERVVASAPWLRRQVDVVDPQQREEPQAHDSSDAPEVHGDLQTHVPSEATQGTPLVVPDMCHPATDRVLHGYTEGRLLTLSHTVPLPAVRLTIILIELVVQSSKTYFS